MSSSDEKIAQAIDGLVIPKKLGEIIITDKWFKANIIDRNKNPEEKIIYLQNKYKSKNGNCFSKSNYYTMTSQDIFDEINEAFQDGYSHIIFPKINFYLYPKYKLFILFDIYKLSYFKL